MRYKNLFLGDSEPARVSFGSVVETQSWSKSVEKTIANIFKIDVTKVAPFASEHEAVLSKSQRDLGCKYHKFGAEKSPTSFSGFWM